MSQLYTLSDLGKAIGKDAFAVSNIQKILKLPVLEEGYSESYLSFVTKVSALQSFSISSDRVEELLETEKKILKLLHLDALHNSPTWFLEGCSMKGQPEYPRQILLLTGFDIGFAVDGDAVQESLNFGKKESELFAGVEMGEDVKRVMVKYRDMCKSVKKQLRREKPALERAIKWAKSVIRS